MPAGEDPSQNADGHLLAVSTHGRGEGCGLFSFQAQTPFVGCVGSLPGGGVRASLAPGGPTSKHCHPRGCPQNSVHHTHLPTASSRCLYCFSITLMSVGCSVFHSPFLLEFRCSEKCTTKSEHLFSHLWFLLTEEFH